MLIMKRDILLLIVTDGRWRLRNNPSQTLFSRDKLNLHASSARSMPQESHVHAKRLQPSRAS